MDVKKYISSGILELYCLGSLSEDERSTVEAICREYPQVKAALTRVEIALENYSVNNSIAPPEALGNKIIAAMINSRPRREYPLLDTSSNYRQWLDLTRELTPSTFAGSRFVKVLTQSPAVTQLLLVSSSDFEDETHDDLLESFLILDGKCECTVGDDVFCLEAGGYTEIPLYQPHSVKVLTPTVTAILQRLALPVNG